VDEGMPCISQRKIGLTDTYFFIEIEYFQEDIVGEHVDCHQAYIGRISVGSA